MSSPVRRRVFVAAGVGFAALLLWAFAGMPDFGHYVGPYGDILNRSAIPERHVTDVVGATNFDYRAFDTLGEEFILFAAVVGVASLLRELREERHSRPRDDARGRRVREPSVAVTLIGLALVAPTLVIGLYVVLHGHQTPGGGFQGGVILATALLLVFLADQYVTLRRVGPMAVIEIAEAAGAASLALIGVSGLIWGGAFFANVLGVGTTGMLLSGGIVLPGNLAVGLAVTGGFAFMLSEFLEQTLVLRRHGQTSEDE